jgi:hypothetical protein
MKNDMDHERCSELLLPYLQEELDTGARAEVEDHLASCSDCTEERAALERLLAVEIEPMTASERSSMRARVAKELAPGVVERRVQREPARAPKWWSRALPALGAVALVAVAAVFAANLLSGGSGDGESAVRGPNLKAGSGAGDEAGDAGGVAPEAAGPEALADKGRSQAPYFNRGRGVLRQALLDELAKKEPAFEALAGVTASRATNIRDTYTGELARQAPPSTRSQLRACAESVAASQGTVVPAYGTEGKYHGKDALLVGFVSGSNSGPLNRYMLWLWPKGSCEIPIGYVSGALEK